MSIPVPNIPVGKTPITTWFNRVSNAIPANVLVSSIGYKVKPTTGGTSLVIDPPEVQAYMQDRGNYEGQAGYNVQDVVTVYHDQIYTDSNYNAEVIFPSAGTWVCESAIPDKDMSDRLKQTFTGSASSSYAQYIRKEGVDYVPTWPEPATLASETSDGKGRYWRLIGMQPISMSVCVNGVMRTAYIGMIPSGSFID